MHNFWKKIFWQAGTRPAGRIPASYVLHQNYPNPFNPSTKITYDLPSATHVTIRLYNMLGELVRTLVDEDEVVGVKILTLARDELPSGVYYYRMTAGSFTDVRKLIIMK